MLDFFFITWQRSYIQTYRDEIKNDRVERARRRNGLHAHGPSYDFVLGPATIWAAIAVGLEALLLRAPWNFGNPLEAEDGEGS